MVTGLTAAREGGGAATIGVTGTGVGVSVPTVGTGVTGGQKAVEGVTATNGLGAGFTTA